MRRIPSFCKLCSLLLFIILCMNEFLKGEVKRAIKGKDVTGNFKIKSITKTIESYTYASRNKKNPFIPPLASDVKSKVEIPIVSPLQKYDISEIKVIGVWSVQNKKPKCLISTPGQEGIIATIGDFVGNKGGVVHQINKNGIKIREFKLLYDGSRIFKDIDLLLGTEKSKEKREKIVIEASSN